MKKIITKTAFLLLSMIIIGNFQPNKMQFAYAINDEISINASASYMIETSSNTEIIDSNADKKLPIASMTKLATLALVFREIDNGRLSIEDDVEVSQNAASIEGSSAFLDAGSKYKVKDLIKTVVIVSANDSSVALAEKICGTEELFVRKMNNLAKELNLSNTHFENSTGLPSPSHFSSARDIAKIYSLICDNSLYKEYAKVWMEDFIHPSGRKTGLVNTNRLVKTYSGCTGGKTGHTSEAKYCLTASASRNGINFIAVVIGAETSKIRFSEVTKMFNYGFANYTLKSIVNKELPLAKIDIKGANIKNCALYASEDFGMLEKKGEEKQFATKLIMPDMLKAPIHKNQCVGKIVVLNENNIVIKEIDLLTIDDIKQITFAESIHKLTERW